MIRIKPTKGRVIVEPITESESSKGGIIIPDAHQDKSTEGVVVSLSATNKLEVNIGDRVVFARHGGTDVKSGNRMFKMLDANEIFAVIEHS